MNQHAAVHILRNPWSWSEEEMRQARLWAADAMQAQAAEIAALRGRGTT